jgi:hypothetical protein
MPISRSQMPRQMYGLGSLVKSIGKTVKKVVGSPLGKAAILGFGANALMPGGLSSLFSGGGGLASMFGKAKSFIGGLSGMQKAAGAAGILGLGGAFGGMEDEQVEELKSNPEALANYLRSYYSRLNKTASPQEVENFVQRNMQANGGRIGYSDGTPKKGLDSISFKDMEKFLIKMPHKIKYDEDGNRIEREIPRTKGPAKFDPDRKIPRLLLRNKSAFGGRIMRAYGSDKLVEQASGIEGLDININPKGVKELDLRDSGGFIPPVGVKEKADDIPAMLSNNEFVMTADAVREFGDGNVNKGAQRMYDMMKKLENGGKV